MAYVRRILDDELDELFAQVPAIAIDGPKAVAANSAFQRADPVAVGPANEPHR